MFLRTVSWPDSQNQSADFEQARVALITPPRPAALLGSATQLFVANHRQNCPALPRQKCSPTLSCCLI
jgi:hypothetical protein